MLRPLGSPALAALALASIACSGGERAELAEVTAPAASATEPASPTPMPVPDVPAAAELWRVEGEVATRRVRRGHRAIELPASGDVTAWTLVPLDTAWQRVAVAASGGHRIALFELREDALVPLFDVADERRSLAAELVDLDADGAHELVLRRSTPDRREVDLFFPGRTTREVHALGEPGYERAPSRERELARLDRAHGDPLAAANAALGERFYELARAEADALPLAPADAVEIAGDRGLASIGGAHALQPSTISVRGARAELGLTIGEPDGAAVARLIVLAPDAGAPHGFRELARLSLGAAGPRTELAHCAPALAALQAGPDPRERLLVAVYPAGESRLRARVARWDGAASLVVAGEPFDVGPCSASQLDGPRRLVVGARAEGPPALRLEGGAAR